jgi:hypothetical protein
MNTMSRHRPSPAIQGDAVIFEHRGDFNGRKPRTPIGVEDFCGGYFCNVSSRASTQKPVVSEFDKRQDQRLLPVSN